MDPLLGSAITGGSSLLGSLFAGLAQNAAVKNTNKTNLEIARQNNQTSMDIARQNNEMQVAMQRENNAFNRNSALEMFNLENEYNTPEAQKQRLLAAGLNPSTMYGGSSQAASGNADGSTPSAATSGISPSMPSLTTPTMQAPPSVLGAMFGNLESVTRSLANLASSGKTEVEKKRIEQLLTEELKQAVLKTKNQELENQVNQFNFELDKVYKSVERDSGARKAVNEVVKTYNEAILAGLKGDTEKANKLLADAETVLKKTNNELLVKQLPFLVQQAEETVKLTQEQQKTEKATQSMYAANEYKAEKEAKYTDEQLEILRKTKYDIIQVKHMEKEQFKTKLSKLPNFLDAELDRLESSGLVEYENYKKLKEQVKKLRKENDVYLGQQILDAIEQTLDIANKATNLLDFLE